MLVRNREEAQPYSVAVLQLGPYLRVEAGLASDIESLAAAADLHRARQSRQLIRRVPGAQPVSPFTVRILA
jgi:hypothetical protein